MILKDFIKEINELNHGCSVCVYTQCGINQELIYYSGIMGANASILENYANSEVLSYNKLKHRNGSNKSICIELAKDQKVANNEREN